MWCLLCSQLACKSQPVVIVVGPVRPSIAVVSDATHHHHLIVVVAVVVVSRAQLSPVPLPFHPRPTLSASSGNMTRIHICYSCMIHKPILRFGCTTVVAVRSLFFLKAYLFLPCWNKTVLFAVRNKLYSICRFVFLWKYRLDKLYLCLRNVILGASIASNKSTYYSLYFYTTLCNLQYATRTKENRFNRNKFAFTSNHAWRNIFIDHCVQIPKAQIPTRVSMWQCKICTSYKCTYRLYKHM